nr:glycine cleavage T C-terminal barrel domain-containing protein [Bradyrhizobium sp. 180]
MTVVLDTDGDANPIGGEPMRINGIIQGRVTSAAFGFRVGRPVCLGYLKGELSELEGSKVEVDVAGRRCPGRAMRAPAFDPEGIRLRSGSTFAAA